MDESTVRKGSVKTGIRAISLLLIVGGIAGAALALWTEVAAYPSYLVFFGLAILLFGWNVWVGIDLWQGKVQSYKWAQVLFIMQIPNVTFHGFSYQFYVGMMLGLSFTREAASKLNFQFEFGSQLNCLISSEIGNIVLGVNLFAVAILIYLAKQVSEHSASSKAPR